MRGTTARPARLRLLGALLAVMLLAAACGGDGEVDQDAVDAALEDAGEAAEEALADAEEAAQGLADAAEEAAADAEEAAEGALEDAQEQLEEATDQLDGADGEEPGQLEPNAPEGAEGADEGAGGAAPADEAQTAAVVAARDAMLGAVPADAYTTTPEEPSAGSPDDEEGEEENPLDSCLPAELQGLEEQVDALRTVEATGTFTATQPGAFGAFGGEVQATAYSDSATARQLLADFGAVSSDQAFLDCVREQTETLLAEDAPTDDYSIEVTSGIPGVTAEVALNITINASFDGQTVSFHSSIIIASRGDLVVEAGFEGDGADPFPADVISAVLGAV